MGGLSLTRFCGRLTCSKFGAEVAHDIHAEGRTGRTAWAARVQRGVQGRGFAVGSRAAGGGGGSLAQVARELALRPDQLRDWARQQTRPNGVDGEHPGETVEQENRRLRREVAVLRQEQAFAKQVAVYFARESR